MTKTGKRILTIMLTLMMGAALIACGGGNSSGDDLPADAYEDDAEKQDKEKDDKTDVSDVSDVSDVKGDIDFDALNDSIDSLKNLDLTSDLNSNSTSASDSTTADAKDSEITDADALAQNADADEPKGDKTMYSYTDVYRDGNDLTVIPNGGLSASTALFNNKDLGGFLDYVDSTVLEQGRTINRDLFYDLLAIMLVDKELGAGQSYIEKNMVMALAVANDMHDSDVRIESCYLDANNAAEYKYKVKAYGKDDTWTVNYQNRSFYMNNGATEYSSDMFKDSNLAVWMVAIEEYYGLQ